MLDFVRGLMADRGFVTRLPSLIAAFLVAELFYKFHSFMLETGAFLVTWLILDLVIERVVPRTAPRR
ncbi:MAG: hypothetical protein JNK67_01065 [Alphaproteobacteria bacterium]|nr:hypothetical protein [Alphaproteobacteria bacterium]